MLSSAKIGTSSWRYYTAGVSCAATEYYLGVGEAPGVWCGRGLEALGLEAGAVVDEAQLEALFARALHPVNGQRLGRAWRVDGVTGFDLTFSAPKSVSSLWALGDRDTAVQMRAAHTAAVEAALAYLDRHASWSRRGVDGTDQVATGGLAAACFEHRTSRCADPQLHTHALVVNKVLCGDGVWRTIDATEIYHHKKSAGMIYQAALRSEIHARTGLEFEPADSNGQAEISGVPPGLLKMWSKRTAVIDAEAAKAIDEFENSLQRSLTSDERAAVTKAAVLKTRPAKTAHDAGTLQERWRAEATSGGFDPHTLINGAHEAAREAARRAGWQAPGQAPSHELGVADRAVRAAASTRAVFSRADVAGQVAALLPVDGRGAAGVLEAVESLTGRALVAEGKSGPAGGVGSGSVESVAVGAVPVGDQPRGRTVRASDARWAGAEVLAAEGRVLARAAQGRGGGYGRAAMSTVLAALDGAGLDRGQRAVVTALAQNGDFLTGVIAPAGAGKTRTLGVAATVWRSTGYRVLGLAPSARAAAELAAATGGPAETLAKWIVEQDRRGLLPAHERARFVIDRRTVVVVDEASMANTHDLDTLVTSAARVGAKVVLVGDPAQIGVVRGPGGMLAALAHAGHGLELDTVHRFEHRWEADASLQLRRGDPAVLEVYREHGRLHPADDLGSAVADLHAQWFAERRAGRDVLMMARTRADVDALNERARASVVAVGEVTGPAVRLGDRDWQSGDLLRARRNDRGLAVGTDGHVRNGDRYRVTATDPTGLHVEHLDRKEKAFLPAAYVTAHSEYGWATTVTAAQGATVDVGLVLVRPGIDREHLYVALTRGRHANHAYIAPDSIEHIDDFTRHRPAAPGHGRDGAAFDVLTAALARSDAQDAAHTARENARTRAAEATRRAAAAAAQAAERAWTAVPPGHTERAKQLSECQIERARLEEELRRHHQAGADIRSEFARTSRLRPWRRRELLDTVDGHDDVVQKTIARLTELQHEIADLARHVAGDTREREARQKTRPTRTRSSAVAEDLTPAPAMPLELVARTAQPRATARRRLADELRSREHRRHQLREPARGLDRDDGLSIER